MARARLPSTPLTNAPALSVEYWFANSTASLMTTPAGVSPSVNSYTARRRIARSTRVRRSIVQPRKNGERRASIASAFSIAPEAMRFMKSASRSLGLTSSRFRRVSSPPSPPISHS